MSLKLIFLPLLLSSLTVAPPGHILGHSRTLSHQDPETSKSYRVRELNVFAPELYADQLRFVATLLDMPGAKNRNSYWELSYQLFYVPEAKYYEALKNLPRGGFHPGPEQFPGRVLLAQGHKKQMLLEDLKHRTIEANQLAFKKKVEDWQRTKSAILMTSFSVKVFDADLDANLYHAGIYLTDLFEEVAAEPAQLAPRKTIYLTFMVSRGGALNHSQSAPEIARTIWQQVSRGGSP
jgi:hypothetical protein